MAYCKPHVSWSDYMKEHGAQEYAEWDAYVERMKAEGHKTGCAVFHCGDCDCGKQQTP